MPARDTPMRIYWTLKSIPELAPLPAKERGRVWRAAYWRTFKDWRGWAAAAVVGVCAGLGSAIGAAYGHQMLYGVIGAGIGGAISGQIWTHLAIPHLRELLGVNRKA